MINSMMLHYPLQDNAGISQLKKIQKIFQKMHFCRSFFKNIDQDGQLFNFLSISRKAWCELWHSSHNEILTPLSWCLSSCYFKNHWCLKLFLKGHRRSQNVYFFYLGPIISLNIPVYFSEAVVRRCSVKKGVLGNFTKFKVKACNFI